jgi:Mg2+/Co2+ transporter CorB
MALFRAMMRGIWSIDMSIFLTILLILLLLVLAGFFVMAETSLATASRSKILTLAQEGEWRAKTVSYIWNKHERFLTALLLLNKIVAIVAIVVATDLCVRLCGGKGLIIATLLMTILVVVFAEILPRSYAMQKAEQVAMTTAPFIRVILMMMLPLTVVFGWLMRRLTRSFGADFDKVQYSLALEELRGAWELQQHEQGHETDEDDTTRHERAMMRSILDLTNVTVSEVMIHRRNVDMLDAEMSPQEVIDRALASPYSRLPIYQNDPENIVGVIHGKLLTRQLRAMDGQREEIDILSMVSEPWFIPETTTLFDQLQSFRERREHFALVVDEYGAWQGIVTLEDILEEIVGQIDDEHDQVNHAVHHEETDGEAGYVVDGTMTIRDLNREFDWYLPNDDYATVAGLILYESQIVPEIGQSFVFYNYRFDVLERQRHQITKVRITPLDQNEIE